MNYKTEIFEYKEKAISDFKSHLNDLEANVIKSVEVGEVNENKAATDIFMDYQSSVVNLINGKFELDNEFLKSIAKRYLEENKGANEERYQKIEEKLLSNHTRVLNELKESYDQIASESREELKNSLDSARNDKTLAVDEEPKELFPEKMHVLSLNFLLITILLLVIIFLVYKFYFMA